MGAERARETNCRLNASRIHQLPDQLDNPVSNSLFRIDALSFVWLKPVLHSGTLAQTGLLDTEEAEDVAPTWHKLRNYPRFSI